MTNATSEKYSLRKTMLAVTITGGILSMGAAFGVLQQPYLPDNISETNPSLDLDLYEIEWGTVPTSEATSEWMNDFQKAYRQHRILSASA